MYLFGDGEFWRATPSVTRRRDTSLKEGGRLPQWGRCHRGAMTEGVSLREVPTPLPPPVRGMRGRGWLVSTGGGENSIHLISKGGDGRQWRPSIAGLRSRSGRSWARPTGAQDPNRQVRRCHRRAMTEGVILGRRDGGPAGPG